MCCFSGTVEDVGATRIFARMADSTRQLIAYEMEIQATDPIAMILAVPTPPASPADSVRFIALDGCINVSRLACVSLLQAVRPHCIVQWPE